MPLPDLVLAGGGDTDNLLVLHMQRECVSDAAIGTDRVRGYLRRTGALHNAWWSAENPMFASTRLCLLQSLRLVVPDKVEAGRVNAIALPGRSWAIIEDMPQMATAATAADLDAVHAMAKILIRLDGCWVHVVERGPATARLKLRLRSE